MRYLPESFILSALKRGRAAEHLADRPVAVLGQLLYIHDHRAKHPGLSGGRELPDVQPNVSTMSGKQTVKHLLR
ncbi:hypothetical protein ACFRLW_45975, partial [Streptomyces sp. NPDC056728]